MPSRSMILRGQRNPALAAGGTDAGIGSKDATRFIRMKRVASFDPIPASVPPAAKAGFLCPRRIIDRDGIAIQKARFTGIALFGENDTDAQQLRFVGEQVNELGMRDLHKLLVVLSAHLDLLFPEYILPVNKRADAFCHPQLDDLTAGSMQVLHDPAIAVGR